MKKSAWRTIRIIMFLLAAAFGTALFFSCANGGTPAQNESKTNDAPVFKVYLSEDAECFGILSENPASAPQGGEVCFTLRMKDNKCISRLTRQSEDLDAEIINEIDGTTTLRLTDIRYSFYMSAECVEARAYISYDPNGGEYLDGSDASYPYTVGHELKSRLRPNTEIGTDRMARAGYVQTGWNTKPDGTGEHLGLGSRATVGVGKTLYLYAEWAKESPDGDFVFRKYGKGYTIVGYTGHDEVIVVPHRHDGGQVDIIAGGAFADADAKTVILPETVEVISDGAFTGCKMQELYLYDGVTFVSDAAFADCPYFATVHINALLAPRFAKNLYSEYNLADKYDLLILNQDKKKLIIFGGSGVYNSLDALRLEETLAAAGEDYYCLNMAVNGWFNGAAQLDMISAYLRAGDIFLHAPETSSGYSFLYDVTMTPWGTGFDYNKLRFYYCVESNYDLFSLVDLRHVTEFFDGFKAFNDERADMEPTSYTDYKTDVVWYGEVITRDWAYMDGRGTLTLPKESGKNRSTGEADIVVEYVTSDRANERLNGYYDAFARKGVTVLFTNAPINKDTLQRRLDNPASFDRASADGVLYYGRPAGIGYPEYDSLETWISVFEEAVTERLHCEVLVPLSQTLYVTKDFFEPDYHLCDEATPGYTDRIADALIGRLHGEGGAR